ncbi:MAG TPA: tail fiber domain-containing protein [Pyrinomonadaceae bacterium]|nr:tail fiber domain-containing protein [Pyrinomonadaceae bacterium]
MSIVRKQPTLVVLLGWVALTTLAALTQTAFAYQDRAKQASVTLKDNKPTQTAFTYQGQLKEGSVPANGTYTFRFALYPGQSGGRNQGVVIKDDVVVNKGSFTVQLDFGNDGSSSNESWLEVGARRPNTADSYTELSPRQRLTPMPSAIAAQAEPRSVIGVPLAPQDLGAWIKDGRTVRLATSTDNVGIGTTKPVATLDVAGTIHASEAVTVGNSVGLLSSGSLNLIEVDNSNPLAIGFSNPFTTTPNPVAFSTIRVGIGTTSPTNTLDVNGQARIRVLPPNPLLNDVVVAAPNGVLFRRPASTLGGGGNFWSLTGNALTTTGNEVLGTTNNFPLRFITNGPNAEKMRIQTNGNVGIATTTPTQKLTLGSGNAFLPSTNGGTDGNLYFGGITDTGQVGMRLFGGLVNTSIPGGFIDVRVNPANLSDGLRFRVDANNGGTERMRITASGNVGIGTTSPTKTLDVNGQARIRVLTPSPLLNDVVVADSSGVLFTRPASTIGGGGNFWSLTGNAATPGNFLGTTVNVPLEIRVNNKRVFLIEDSLQAPNIVGGSSTNSVTSGVGGGTIAGGGFANMTGNGNTVTGNFGTVGGGRKNEAANFSTVGGGFSNTASGANATVSGGNGNTASGLGSTISGGFSNTVTGNTGTVAGGQNNVAAGALSFAAGTNAHANHNGAFVWADLISSASPVFASTAANQFNVRASGGYRFSSEPTGTIGAQIFPGATAWSLMSDRNVKENFQPIEGRLILQKLSLIPITEWNLKSQDPSIRHIGPMAQDFYAAFGLGESDRHISTIDADGITLVSIQALYQMNLEKDKKIEELQQRIEKLEKLMARL